jgi:ATP-dependent exoDNAse (exonuclease V) alpha subunit
LDRKCGKKCHSFTQFSIVGDPEQLQAIEAGAAFRGIVGQVGMAEMTEVRRQKEAWMREATQALSSGRTAEALRAYEGQGGIVAADTRAEAREQLRNSRDVNPRFHGMSVQHFRRWRPRISGHVGPGFHGMSVQFVR